MSSATISECGRYRYTLGRNIDSDSTAHKPCLFVMLNPSTADANVDDPTIRRCIGFAKRERCTFLTVVNLFSFRATDPRELIRAHAAGGDVFGPDHRQHFTRELRRHNVALGHVIIAAWGANPIADHAVDSMQLLREAGAKCLGVTKDNSPRHPLYVRADQPLVPWIPA